MSGRYTVIDDGSINYLIIDRHELKNKRPKGNDQIVEIIWFNDYDDDEFMIYSNFNNFAHYARHIMNNYNRDFFAYNEEIIQYLYGEPVLA